MALSGRDCATENSCAGERAEHQCKLGEPDTVRLMRLSQADYRLIDLQFHGRDDHARRICFNFLPNLHHLRRHVSLHLSLSLIPFIPSSSPPLQCDLHPTNSLLFFPTSNAFIVPIVYFFYPETAYRSLEEMDAIFVKTTSIFNVVRVARDEPRRYDKNGRPLINYEDTDMAERRGSVLTGGGRRMSSRAGLEVKSDGGSGSEEKV